MTACHGWSSCNTALVHEYDDDFGNEIKGI